MELLRYLFCVTKLFQFRILICIPLEEPTAAEVHWYIINYSLKRLPDVAVEWVELVFRIQVVTGSILARKPVMLGKNFHGFSQSLWEVA
jgi:hypothetical protein